MAAKKKPATNHQPPATNLPEPPTPEAELPSDVVVPPKMPRPIAPDLDALISDFSDKHGKKHRFLVALAATAGNFSRACDAAQVARSTAYGWLDTYDRHYDAGFAAAYARAELRGAQVLEDECRRRAFEGTLKAITFQGRVTDYEIQYSDMLAAQLLKARHPMHKPSLNVQGSGKNGAVAVEVIRDEALASMPEDALLEHIRVLREAITYVREDVEARTARREL
jgi:hypothetical protein